MVINMEINNLVNFLKNFINDHADYGDRIVGDLSDKLQQNFPDLFGQYKPSSPDLNLSDIINKVFETRIDELCHKMTKNNGLLNNNVSPITPKPTKDDI